MGLFDFGRSIGAKLFNMGSDGRAEDALKEYIEKDNPGVEDLKVDVDDGVATLSGKAKDRAAFEKLVLMAGNVQDIESVNADKVEILDDSPAAEEVIYYEIKKGDSLSKIAKEFLGDAMKYPVLFEANREVIKDPDLIYPGQKIRIPK